MRILPPTPPAPEKKAGKRPVFDRLDVCITIASVDISNGLNIDYRAAVIASDMARKRGNSPFLCGASPFAGLLIKNLVSRIAVGSADPEARSNVKPLCALLKY